MKYITIRFTFKENGSVHTTTWTARCVCEAAAIREAREWFGFDKDGIKVLKTEVIEGNGGENE